MIWTLSMRITIYVICFIFGIIIGSFVNVLIYRLPLHENIVTENSHCMTCGHKLKWYDLFPLFSYLFLRGKCRYCKAKLSVQYPLVEFINGLFYVLIFIFNGINVTSICYALSVSMLIALSVIDWRTYEIPFGLNIAILVFGIINMAFNYKNFLYYLIGMVCVSGFLLLLYLITKGRGIGGGDIKLMFVFGLVINPILGLFVLFIASFLALPVSLIILLKRNVNLVPFGPFLLISCMFIYFTRIDLNMIIEFIQSI